MRNNQKLQNNKVVLLSTIILIVTLLVTIGYAAFSDQLTITDIVAHVRVYKEVRINGVTTGSGSVSNLDYDSNSILNTVSIPAGESVTYSVTATNLGSVPVAVSAISFANFLTLSSANCIFTRSCGLVTVFFLYCLFLDIVPCNIVFIACCVLLPPICSYGTITFSNLPSCLTFANFSL